MSAQFQDHRWTSPPHLFAVRFHVDDIPGIFQKELIVEPGTRALIVDDGQYIGDVPAGRYNLQSFTDLLRFWRKKQCTVILVRSEDQTLELACDGIPTVENLLVEVSLRITVQISDVPLFLTNLFGARQEFSLVELRSTIYPLLRQSLWTSIGRSPIAALSGPDVQVQVDALLNSALELSFKRYGLRFSQVQTVAIKHKKYDEHRKVLGETWLQKLEMDAQNSLNQLSYQRMLEEIKSLEKTNELEILAEQVKSDRIESDVSVAVRRLSIMRELKAAILSEKFNRLQNESSFDTMLKDVDKRKLIRSEEFDSLKRVYREQGEDREMARKQLVARLDVERQFEISRLRADLDYGIRLQALNHEIEIAKLTNQDESRRWEKMLDQQIREADHRRQEDQKNWEYEKAKADRDADNRRTGELADGRSKRELDAVHGEIEVAQAERRIRIRTIEEEFSRSQQNAQLEFERRRKEVDRQVSEVAAGNTLDRFEKWQKVKLEVEQARQELEERKKRFEAELAALRDDKASEHRIRCIQSMRGMSTEELIAVGNRENIEILAALKKHEASVQSNHEAAIRESMIRREASEQLNQLHERRFDDERASSLARARELRELAEKGFSTISEVAQRPSQDTRSSDPRIVDHSDMVRVLLCPKCRAENSSTNRFCGQCREPL